MRFTVIFKTLGSLLMLFSFSMLPPVAVALIYQDGDYLYFILSFLITFLAGFLCWFVFRYQNYEMKVKDGFLLVVACWITLSIFGALPFFFELHGYVSIAGGFFESVSGLTATGASVLSSHLEALSYALLYYRQQLEFLGGMGIILLAVAILPALGIGGLQLYSKEITGPVEIRLTPRIAQTARALWMIYCGLVCMCALSYWVAGMTFFDAICESFATLSTGGFSIHSLSFAYYQNYSIYLVGMVFMILGAINFGVHFHCLIQRKWNFYWKNTEVKVYLCLLVGAILVVFAALLIADNPGYYHNTFLNAAFNVISVGTTTGFVTENFHKVSNFFPLIFVFLAFVGGCVGSSAGGLKVFRFIVLHKQAMREMKRLMHPNIVYPVKIEQPISYEILQSVWGFSIVFLGLSFVLTVLLVSMGLSLTDAFVAVMTCISGTGGGITQLTREFSTINNQGLYVLIVTMLLGRLELFTILILFVPEFWRR
jgi:trk system potassium uptake protein TrkH